MNPTHPGDMGIALRCATIRIVTTPAHLFAASMMAGATGGMRGTVIPCSGEIVTVAVAIRQPATTPMTAAPTGATGMRREGSASADAKTAATDGVPDSAGPCGNHDKQRTALFQNLSVIDGIVKS